MADLTGAFVPSQVNKDTLKVSASLPPTRPGGLSVPGAAATPRGSINGELVARARAPSVAIDADMVSEFDPSSSDSGVVSRCAVVKPLKLRLCQPIFGRRSGASKSKRRPGGGGGGGSVSGGGSGSGSRRDGTEDIAPSTPTSTAPPKVHKPRDPEREKRRIARKKEKRATLILGLIMGSFIACWLPFFFLYILTPLCPACAIPDFAFSIAFWLGYMNSALNPVIYTIFNKDFRRAFRRILFK